MSLEALVNNKDLNIKTITYLEEFKERPIFDVYRDFSPSDLESAKLHLAQKAESKILSIGTNRYDLSDLLIFTNLLFKEKIDGNIKKFTVEIFDLMLNEYDFRRTSLTNNYPIQNLAAIKSPFPDEFEKLKPEILKRKNRIETDIEINNSENVSGTTYWPGSIIDNLISYKIIFPETDILTPFNNIWKKTLFFPEANNRVKNLIDKESDMEILHIYDILIDLGFLKIIDKEKFNLFNIDDEYFEKLKEIYLPKVPSATSEHKLRFAGAMTILTDPNPTLTESGISLSKSEINNQFEIIPFPSVRSF